LGLGEFLFSPGFEIEFLDRAIEMLHFNRVFIEIGGHHFQ
jgi:hypothetical protein